MTPHWLVRAWDEALEERHERSVSPRLMTVKGFRRPKRGRWTLDLKPVRSLLPPLPMLSFVGLGTLAVTAVSLVLWHLTAVVPWELLTGLSLVGLVLAPEVDALPVVRSTQDRGARFPNPLPDQQVFNKGTGNIERYDPALGWVIEILGAVVPGGLPGYGSTITTAAYARGTSGNVANDNAVAVNAAIAAAPGLGASAVFVVGSHFPFNASNVVYSTAVLLTGEGLRNDLPNVMAYGAHPSNTAAQNAAAVNAAIAYAAAQSPVRSVWIPLAFQGAPYAACVSLVTFNSSVPMLCEGGPSSVDDYDPAAYGAPPSDTGDAYPALAAVTTNIVNGAGRVALRDAVYRISRPILISGSGAKIKGVWRTDGIGGTRIKATYAYGPVICFGGSHVVPTGAALATGAGSSFAPNLTQYYIGLRDAATLDLNGLAAFAVEFFFKPATTDDGYITGSSGKHLIADALTTCFAIFITSGQFGAQFTSSVSGQKTITTSTAISAGITYHVALTFDGTTARLFVNGALAGSQAMTGTVKQNLAEDVLLGTAAQYTPDAGTLGVCAGGAGALLDSFRVSNVARYTAGFTPPTAKFVSDANTLLLCNFDLQSGPMTRGFTKNGDAWLVVREAGSATAGTQVDIEDVGITGTTTAGITGLYITGQCYRPKINRVRIASYRNGILAPIGNAYAWRWGEVFLDNFGFDNSAFPARYGIALGPNAGLGHIDVCQLYGGYMPLYTQAAIQIDTPFIQCLTDTVYGALFFGCGVAQANFPSVNTELGVHTLFRASLALAAGGGTHLSVTLIAANIESANNKPPILIDGPDHVIFHAPLFGVYGSAASLMTVLTVPGSPVQFISPRLGSGWTPLSDVAGAAMMGGLGKLPPLAFSATPIFDASGRDSFEMALTGNVTSSTLINVTPGQEITFVLTQDVTGGRTFAWPANVKNTPPVNPAANAITFATGKFDGTNLILLPSSADAQLAGVTAAVVAKTGAYTATSADFEINCDPTGGAFTVTLPTAGVNPGKVYRLKHKSASGNNVTITPASGQIDSAASKVLSTLQSADVQFDGTNYWIS